MQIKIKMVFLQFINQTIKMKLKLYGKFRKIKKFYNKRKPKL